MTKLSKFKLKGVKAQILHIEGCKRSKLQIKGCKSTELHMEGCKRSNLQTQKLWMAHKAIIIKYKVKNTVAIDKLVSWIYRFDLLHSAICSSVLSHPLICSFDLLHQIGRGNTSPTPTPLRKSYVHPWICLPGIRYSKRGFTMSPIFNGACV